ncbi:hypothetical protein T11_15420 [Trichinella zimbabwensis]|uniref:Uncharacterized protein n=1 Tax=Trichinella zimbabwensis TaxID=268475 RepID=A0A0V1GVT5_9BILA|nr:hypothetical protein T11_15420 [Trichinella zimbabwensis]
MDTRLRGLWAEHASSALLCPKLNCKRSSTADSFEVCLLFVDVSLLRQRAQGNTEQILTLLNPGIVNAKHGL